MLNVLATIVVMLQVNLENQNQAPLILSVWQKIVKRYWAGCWWDIECGGVLVCKKDSKGYKSGLYNK